MFKLDSKTGFGNCEAVSTLFRFTRRVRLRGFFEPSSLCSILVVGSSNNSARFTSINNTNMKTAYICILSNNQCVMRVHLPKRGESATPSGW